jgi:hypothetical protein|tara:strand:+ start:28453 stop:29385 length:933 start_codon:yes stop_codon:yes gene_type:complete
MKIYLTNISESWIIDRLKHEWIINNKKINTRFPYLSQVIWDIAPWVTNVSFIEKYKNKKIIKSIYHIENSSYNSEEVKKIEDNDEYVDGYHVISPKTKEELSQITKKPIFYLPFWVNQNIWYYKKNKDELRIKYGFSNNDYLVGSFQRDTEGSDLISPKLVKGPDILIELVKDLYSKNKALKVVLTGKRRGFVISELKKNKIPYKYFEMTDFSMMNELYNILDLYLITSRIEGGPQALVECGQTKTPVISTDVGIAKRILAPESIFDYKTVSSFNKATPNVETAYVQSSKLSIPKGMLGYIEMFNKIYES